jgi:hypothetical protein
MTLYMCMCYNDIALGSLACSVSWFIYGVCIQNIFVVMPNVFGILMSSAQLVLIYRYPARRFVQHT